MERKSAPGSRYGNRCARTAQAGAWLLAAGAAAAVLSDARPEGGAGLLPVLVLAVAAGGLTAELMSLRRARDAAQLPATAPLHSTAPRLWARAARAPAEPAVPTPLPEPPPVPSPEPPAGSAGPPAPPEPDRAWAAEIGWHLVDGASQFRITARPVEGGEPVTLGVSAPLEWPPRGARSVQALTEAVRTLESALVEAGWTALPRGSAWYAKRYTWQPGARPRPALATAGRTRHRKLYDAEYQRQVTRTEALRRTISDRLLPRSDRDDAESSG